jgi:hypothetical protein
MQRKINQLIHVQLKREHVDDNCQESQIKSVYYRRLSS